MEAKSLGPRLGKKMYSLDALKEVDNFAVNILASEHQSLSNQFASPLGEKWNGVDFSLSDRGVPLLDGALAQFECVPYAYYEGVITLFL